MTLETRKRNRAFFILCAAIFVAMLGVGIIIPFLPIYAKELGAGGLWLGIIFSGFAFSRSMVMPFIGRISDRQGRKKLLAVGLLFYSLLSLAYIYASSAPALALVRLIHGLASALVLPIATAYIGDLAKKAGEGRAMGTFNLALFSGFGFGPLMGGMLHDWLSFSAAFLAMGLLSLVSFLLVWIALPESPRALGISPRQPESLPHFKDILKNDALQAVLSYRFLHSIGRGAISAFLPLFAAQTLGLSTSVIGLVISFQILSASALQYPMGVLADKVSRRFLVMIGSLGAAPLLMLIPHTHNFTGLFLVAIMSGVMSSFSFPASTAMAVEKGRSLGMGSVMGFFSTAMDWGLMIGPLIAGVIYDYLDLSRVFYFGGSMELVGVLAFAFLTRNLAKRN